MPLSEQQKFRLEAEAKKRGVDPDRLIREAEAISDERSKSKQSPKEPSKPSAPTTEIPPLYQYHLPFVTVNEVRTRWLKLDPIAGGDVTAGEWIAKQSSPTQAAAPAAKPPDEA